MRIAVMQPYFFPYLGYWQLIHSVDVFVVFDDVNFIKKGWINRNNILLNGRPHLLTLPLKDVSQWKKINEIETANDAKTQEKILKTIICAYKKAPYFADVFPIIEQTVKGTGLVSELLETSLRLVCEYCGTDTKIILSSQTEKDNSLKGQDKIIEICKKLGASDYVNAIGGQHLYSKDVFAANGIDLHFIKMNDGIRYKQFGDDFVPNLSVIDVLMFNDKTQLKKMMQSYSLI
ncbi:MAG: WbqC family protein [Alphaproteobacteria bacterium]|nr:WbqC family protein [Alphaproteobacteria bacterium]